jgi:predicted TIM-barrel enzyme
MAQQYRKAEFIARLRAKIARGDALLQACAGSGIIAKFLERGGCDIIGVYSTGRYRINGWGSMAGMLPVCDANQMIYEQGLSEIMPMVTETPVIAGVNANDPNRELRRFLAQIKEAGFSGVHNFPTIGLIDGTFRDVLEQTGFKYEHEMHMLKLVNELDMVSIAYAFNTAETELIMQAQPDIFIFHAGITRGGAIGYSGAGGIEDTAARSQAAFEVAKRVKPDVILMAHGAALATADDGKYMLEHTDAVGIQVGSAIERLAIEEPLEARTQAFAALRKY